MKEGTQKSVGEKEIHTWAILIPNLKGSKESMEAREYYYQMCWIQQQYRWKRWRSKLSGGNGTVGIALRIVTA